MPPRSGNTPPPACEQRHDSALHARNRCTAAEPGHGSVSFPAVGRGGRRLQRLNRASELPSSRCAMRARSAIACWTMRLRMTYSVPAPRGPHWPGQGHWPHMGRQVRRAVRSRRCRERCREPVFVLPRPVAHLDVQADTMVCNAVSSEFRSGESPVVGQEAQGNRSLRPDDSNWVRAPGHASSIRSTVNPVTRLLPNTAP